MCSSSLIELLQPSLDKSNFLFVNFNDLFRRISRLVLAFGNIVLIPMMRGIVNEKIWLRGSRLAVLVNANLVWCSCAPWILFAINNGHSRIREVVATKLVDGFNVWRRGDVEVSLTDGCDMVDRHCSRQDAKCVLGNSIATDKVAPSTNHR